MSASSFDPLVCIPVPQNCKKGEDRVLHAFLNRELEVDNEGKIWRLSARRYCRWTGKTRVIPCKRRRGERLMHRGYLEFSVNVDGVKTYAFSHRVVWRLKNGPIPDGMTINHIDGVKTNNRPDNLELATQKENVAHSITVLGHLRAGSHHHKAKLKESDISEIRSRAARGESHTNLAKEYGVTRSHIGNIVHKRTWTQI